MRIIKETQLAWLAGIIDGEGSLIIFRRTNVSRSGEKIISATASITITNSNNEIINECVRILESYNIKYWLFYNKKSQYRRKQKRIAIRNYGSILKLLEMINGYLIGKKDQVILMKEFVSKAKKRTGFINTKERMSYCFKMSELNLNGNSIP